MIRSPLRSRREAPRQGDEGAPAAWLEIHPPFLEALEGITVDSEVIVLTWLHQANRDVLKVHPRGQAARGLFGVFATRSPDRPNPVGLHRVTVIEVDPARGLRIQPIEAVDGTPVIDMKPVRRCSWDD